MFRKVLWLILVIFTLNNLTNAQEAKWLHKLKQITPLESTERDVEKIFNKPTEQYGNIREYKTKEGILSVTYSTGECDSNLSDYDVDKGIVIEFDFSFEKIIMFKSLNINLAEFEKEESSDTQNIIYKNNQLGIDYDIYKKTIEGISYDKSPELLNSISIYPSEKYSSFKCGKQK